MNKVYTLLLIVFSGIGSLNAQIIFTKTFGSTSLSESAVSMIRTNDNGYALLGVTSSGTIYLVKTDSAGIQQWSKTIHDSTHSYFPEKIAQLDDGSFIIVGRKQLPSIIFYNNFVMKTDAAGNVIWENGYFPFFDYQTCRSVKATSDGNIIITGSCQNSTGFSHTPFTAKLDTAGTVIWSNFNGDFEPYDITELADGSFVSSGYNCNVCTAGSRNVMVAKFTATGASVWIRFPLQLGYNDEWHFISTTLSGDLIVCGTVDTFFNAATGLRNTNIIIAKLDTAGTILWNSKVYLPYRDYDGEIIETADSTFHLAGTVQNVFYGATTNASETAHLQFDQTGNLLCSNFFNPRLSSGSAIVLSSDQKLMIAGYILNDTMLSPDMLLQKIEPNCCTSPAPFTIQTPDTTICPGDTFMLYVNPSVNGTVKWYSSSFLTPLSTTDSLQIPPPNNGGDFYVVKESQCGVTYSPILKIKSGTITSPLLLILNFPTASICAGDSVYLHANFSQTGITIPYWIRDGVAFAQGPVNLWVKDSGHYWLAAYTRCDTIISDTIHVSVSTAPPPTPSITASDTTLCGGTASVVLNATPCTGCVYHWYDETGVYTETDSASYAVSVAQTYTVTVINPCDSASSPDSVVIQNGTLPTVPVITHSGDTLFSSYATGNQWLFNSTIIPGATNQYLLPQQNGLYYATYTENNCTVQSQGFNFIITGVAEIFNGSPFQVYREESGIIFIKTIGNYPLQSIGLFATDGRCKMVLENINSKSYRLKLDAHLPDGIYFLRLYNGKEISTVKLFLKD